jgi:replicative DNA helicase
MNMRTIQPSRESSNGKGLEAAEPMLVFADPAAERALLGALSTSGQQGDLARLDRDDFTCEEHRLLFDSIARRLESGESIDFPLLANDVRAAGVSSGGVFELFDNPGVSVPAYVPLLHVCRMRRMLHSLGACLLAHASDAAREPRDVLRWLERQVGLIQAVAERR